MKTKKSLLLLASVVAAASMSAAIGFTTVSANDTPKTEPDTLGLAAGASVCFGTETVGNGLRYTLEMNKTEYEAFMASGYTDVTFGVLIAPEFYQTKYGAFNEENVFGANNKTPVYGWATWNDETDEWNDYEGTAKQIINLSTDELVEFTAESTTTVKYKASITNLADASISGEFRGVGYVTYKDGETQKYKLATADSNVRAMAYVAKEAIKTYESEIASGKLTEEVKADYQAKVSLLNTNYIAKAKDVSYTVKHHYVKADGTETVTDEAKTAKIYADVTATAAANDYFTFDEENAKNVTSGEAVDGAVLELYYTQNVQALTAAPAVIDVDATTTLTVADGVVNVSNIVIGGTSVLGSMDGATVTLANVDKLATNGLTTMTYVTDTFAYTQDVDVYTLLNFTGESFMREGTELIGGVANHYNAVSSVASKYVGEYEGETNVYKAYTTGYNEAMGVAVAPRHTQAYYVALQNKYASKGLYLAYRVYLEDVSGVWNTRRFSDLGAGNVGDLATGEWHTVLINSGDYTAAINNQLNANYKRIDALNDKYYYHSNGLQLPASTSTVWSVDGLAAGSTGDNHNTYVCRGYLARVGTYKDAARATAIYVTEPMICLGESDLLLDVSKVEDPTQIKISDLLNVNYSDFHISSLTLNGVAVTMPTENTLLSDYVIEGLKVGGNTVVLKAVNKTYGGYMMMQPVTLFNGVVDMCNLNDGVEFTVVNETWLNAGNVKASRYDNAMNLNVVSVATAEQVAADTDVTMGSYVAKGNYYLYNMNSATKCEHGLWVKPSHSKAYYEMLKEQGYTTVQYDYYIADPNKKTGSIGYNGTTSHTEASGKNGWYTASISLDVIIEYFDYYSTGVAFYPPGANGHYRYTEVLHLGWVATHNAKFYVGNFQIVK